MEIKLQCPHIDGLVAAMTESELRMPSERISHHALG
jgi:hypothetical protein